MKCRVYCKHESFVSSEIGIKIVIIKYNIVNSLFIAFKMNRYSVSRSAPYFRHFGVKVQIHVIFLFIEIDECVKIDIYKYRIFSI